MDITEEPVSDLPQAMDTSESGAHNPSGGASSLMHISAIQGARNLEISTLKKSENAFQPNSDKKDRKFPLLSAENKELDKRFSTISQRDESFSPIHKDLSEENDENNDYVTGSQVNFSSQFVKSSDRA